MSTKLWIGLITFYILAQLICNFVENEAMITQANTDNITSFISYSQTTSVDSATGNTVTWFDKMWDFISEVVFFDYTIFKNVDPVTGVATDNNWVIFRYLLIAIGIVVIIEVFLVGRRLIFGS